MTRYHISPESGRPNICSAKIRCEFAVDGAEPPHFNSKQDAKEYAEKKMAEIFGVSKTINRKKAEARNAETDKQDDALKKLREVLSNDGPVAEVSKKPEFKLKDDYDYEEPYRIAVKNGGYGGSAWHGSKVGDEYLPTKEIAKRIRQDLKEATAGGYLPEGVKYSVTMDSYSGGSSLNVEIHVDEPMDQTHEIDDRYSRLDLKPEYKKLLKRVENIQDAYRTDDSNGQVDYFNTNFYGHAQIAPLSSKVRKEHEADRRKFNKIVKEKGAEDLSNDKEFLNQEKEYYNSLNAYFSEFSFENNLWNFTDANKRMPDDNELKDLRKKSAETAYSRVEATKARHDKNGTRFEARS